MNNVTENSNRISDADLIDRLAEALAARVVPTIPFDMALWNISTIAQYLQCSDSNVRERIACRPDFPKARRLPSTSGRRGGQALYRAQEVIDWVEKFADR